MSGRGAGIEVVELDTGPMQVVVLPTRGMGIWQVVCDGVPFKWDSPVAGPVHPSLVPQDEPSGIGWLQGFDELLVRCGITSNGAPDFDEAGRLKYGLHGRIGNTPADRITCKQEADALVLAGDVHEKRLFFSNLRLTSRLRLLPGGRTLEIEDEITNLSASEATSQLLYHINVGAPVLAAGARLRVPFEQLAPKDAHAATDIPTWDRYREPAVGFAEQVHFFKPACDADGNASLMLTSPDDQQGMGLSFNVATLPYFIVWKNTAAMEDGYVTGLEPATNFPNTHSFEAQHDRVTKLLPGQSVTHRLSMCPLIGATSVSTFAEKVDAIVKDAGGAIQEQPNRDWSV